jgi:transcriptional regulator with GAF, ATPase, and Fis domain
MDLLEVSQVERSQTDRRRGLEEMERDYIVQILEETQWKIEGKDGAAAILELNPSTLRG